METICLNEYNDVRINIERVFIYKKMREIIGIFQKKFFTFFRKMHYNMVKSYQYIY